MRKTVVIDCFAESVACYRRGWAVVAVDVVRATTTAISAVAAGRRCLPVATVEAAHRLADALGDALLIGEQRGIKPPGFDLNNSPAELLSRSDLDRPAVLLSSSGTRLCCEAATCDAAFLACLRNYSSVAAWAARYPNVALIGAGSRGEFREEDQMCAAWVAERLMQAGHVAGDRATGDLVARWRKRPADAWTGNKSASYLRSSGQLADLEFILAHIDDLSSPFTMRGGEVVMGDHERAHSDGAECRLRGD